MARDHGKIKSSLWRSKKFLKLTNRDRPKLQYAYFHTCPHANSVGCYPMPVAYMTADLFWGVEQIAETIDELVSVQLIDWNDDEQIVRIVDFIEHDAPTNFKHAAFMVKETLALPDCSQKLRVIEDLLTQRAVRELEVKSKDVWDRLSATRDRLSAAYEGQSPLPCPVPLPEPNHNPPPTEVCTQPSAAPKPPGRKHRLPEGFEPDRDAAIAYWRKRGREDLCREVDDQIAHFIAHHRKVGSAFFDWGSAWVTWYSGSPGKTRAPPQSASHPPAKILSIV